MGFQHLPKEKRSEIASKGAKTRRSPSLEKAWGIASDLRKQYEEGKPPSVIASENKIDIRAVYRIVRGK